MHDHSAADVVHPPTRPDSSTPIRYVVFAVLTAGFLLWIVFGQVVARVWVAGRLSFVDRRIASMWQYLGQNLPSLPASGVFTVLYWVSVAIIVFGTVAGLWLILGTPDKDPTGESVEAIHAAHLIYESD